MAPGPELNLSIAMKRFGAGEPLFKDFHAEIAPGSVIALWAPSGTGKSTLLRLVAGVDSDFTGSVLIDGKPADLAPPPGLVFQDPRLLPWLTVLDNVRTAGQAVSLNDAREALALTGMGDSVDLFPHQLSGGMQRRAALARALALNAGQLLLDEPFVSLDRALVKDMYDVVGRVLDKTRPTTLLVTHMAEDAARLADRVLILAGRPATILANVALEVPRAERGLNILTDYRHRIETAGQRS